MNRATSNGPKLRSLFTHSSTRPGRLKTVLLAFLFALSSILLTACGGGGGGSDSTDSADSGEVVIGLTDAEGDFLAYTVDVTSVTLVRMDGTVVEALPLSTRVDFSQYTEVTEFLTAATIPAGVYKSGSMRLDYSSADIQVEVAGVATPATPLDSDGNPLGVLDMDVVLDNANRLVVAPGVPAHMTLDFDLDASNSVDTVATPPTVTVEPVLIADVRLDAPKVHRLRGPLEGVDLDNSSFAVIMRPFHAAINDRNREYGILHVAIDDDTAFEIDGETSSGARGLENLDQKPLLGATVVLGELQFNPRRFKATEVYYGSSVPGGTLDGVTGNVIARDGNTLTVRGATLIRTDGSAVFRDDVTVLVGEETTVSRQARDSGDFTITDISVGQRVTISGTLTNSQALNLELDAAVGHVRMHYTNLRGTVKTVAASSLEIDLQRIDRRPVDQFDFSGTGVTRDDDAVPTQYEVTTALPDVDQLAEFDPVIVRGFVRPFGAAPADFEAYTIAKVAEAPARMGVGWDPLTSEPFSAISTESLILNMNGVGRIHHLSQNGVITDLDELAAPLTLLPEETGRGLFSIKQDRSVQVHTNFDTFVRDLQARLDGINTVKSVFASGPFSRAEPSITARFITVVFHSARPAELDEPSRQQPQ